MRSVRWRRRVRRTRWQCRVGGRRGGFVAGCGRAVRAGSKARDQWDAHVPCALLYVAVVGGGGFAIRYGNHTVLWLETGACYVMGCDFWKDDFLIRYG